MGYIEDTKGANEKILYVAHFHWMNYVFAYGLLIAAAVLSVLTFNSQYPLVALGPILTGLIIFIAIMLPIWTTQIGVTDQRIIYKRGFIQRETDEMQLSSVEEVSLDQGIVGRILDYGKLEIHGTGEESIFLPAIGDPLSMRRSLQDAIGLARKPTIEVESETPVAVK
ncbi:MAG: PH domain-containing protein [Rhodomicrobium sp.]|nr:PH domain-containing protein [Rhodomicrobium sp.]